MEKVNVRVFSRQTAPDGRQSNLESLAKGEHYYRHGKHYISYEDVTADVDGVTKTLVKIGPDELLLQRKGIVNQEQRFRPGCETESLYRTALGTMELKASTRTLELEVKESCGKALLIYELYINGDMVGVNELQLEFSTLDGRELKMD